MAPGQITQELYVRGLPPGTKLLITDVTFKVPPGDWWPVFTSHESINKNTSDEEKKKLLPIEVTPDYRNGWLGRTSLSSLKVSDTGAGPEIYLRFQLQGTATIDGGTIDLSSMHGFITISTTDWGYLERPDYSNVTYQLADQSPRNLGVEVLSMQSPKDASLIVGVNAKEKKVGVNASVDEDVVKDLIGWALKGIFKAHEKAAGWVIGAI